MYDFGGRALDGIPWFVRVPQPNFEYQNSCEGVRLRGLSSVVERETAQTLI